MYQYPYSSTYQIPKQEVIKVNGMQGANAYLMPPNSSAILIDLQNPIVYLCVTDGAGLKTVTPYTITEYKQEETSEYKSLADRITRLEEIIKNEPHAEKRKRKSEYDAIVNDVEKWES